MQVIYLRENPVCWNIIIYLRWFSSIWIDLHEYVLSSYLNFHPTPFCIPGWFQSPCRPRRYRIPHGGFFDYATQAVYFCEYLGFLSTFRDPRDPEAWKQLVNLLVFIFIILFHLCNGRERSCLGDLLNSGCAPVRVLTECRGIKCFKYQKKSLAHITGLWTSPNLCGSGCLCIHLERFCLPNRSSYTSWEVFSFNFWVLQPWGEPQFWAMDEKAKIQQIDGFCSSL